MPSGSGTRQLRSTITSSARPPSTDTPCRRVSPVRHSWSRPARHRRTPRTTRSAAPRPRCRRRASPANSWPRVTGRFHAARCRSEPQMPHDRTRTRTGSVACAGTVALDLDHRDPAVTRRPHRSHARGVLHHGGEARRGDPTTVYRRKDCAGATEHEGVTTMVDLGFDGKVAIVTGAGGGLGREHSLLLAEPGRAGGRQRPRRRGRRHRRRRRPRPEGGRRDQGRRGRSGGRHQLGGDPRGRRRPSCRPRSTRSAASTSS